MKTMVRRWATAMAVAAALPAVAQTATSAVDNPKYYTRDPNETVITDIGSWSHPTKDVFEKSHLALTKVELMWDKKFPVFHVKSFGADPSAGPAHAFFVPLEVDLIKANGGNAFKMVEDEGGDGFVVYYDRKTRAIHEALVQGEQR